MRKKLRIARKKIQKPIKYVKTMFKNKINPRKNYEGLSSDPAE